MKYLMALLLCLALATPAHALTVRYAGHVAKKILLLPVYAAVATPVALIFVWAPYGGYEKQLVRDFGNNVSKGVKPETEE